MTTKRLKIHQPVAEPNEHEPLPQITCPACGKTDDLNGFDCLGACDDNLFCTRCHSEFDPDTGIVHECNLTAEQAAARREGLPMAHLSRWDSP